MLKREFITFNFIDFLMISLICLSIIVLSTDIDECLSNPCLNGGLCSNGESRYTCTCLAGWTGARCDVGKINRLKHSIDSQETSTFFVGVFFSQIIDL